MTKLVVAIATSGRPLLLERTLRSLSQCAQPPNYGGTIVAENGTRSGAEAIARRYDAEYLYVPLGNKSHALNLILDYVRDVLLYFSDDDIRFDPNVLNAIAAAAEQRTSGEFFGGSVRVDFEQEPPDWMRTLMPQSGRGWDVADDAAWRRSPFFLGCNWAAYAADLRRAGGFDIQRGPGSPTQSVGQETAMQERLRRSGVRARRVPEAIVWHWVPRDRCTPEWIFERKYRSGIGHGLKLRADAKSDKVASMFQCWKLMRSVPITMLHWVSGGRKGRFEAKARLYFYKGVIAGYRKNGADSWR